MGLSSTYTLHTIIYLSFRVPLQIKFNWNERKKTGRCEYFDFTWLVSGLGESPVTTLVIISEWKTMQTARHLCQPLNKTSCEPEATVNVISLASNCNGQYLIACDKSVSMQKPNFTALECETNS